MFPRFDGYWGVYGMCNTVLRLDNMYSGSSVIRTGIKCLNVECDDLFTIYHGLKCQHRIDILSQQKCRQSGKLNFVTLFILNLRLTMILTLAELTSMLKNLYGFVRHILKIETLFSKLFFQMVLFDALIVKTRPM